MPASIRIIKIVKDKVGPTSEEQEAYTAEIECEAENAKDLERELISCPYGSEIIALLKRAEFIPEGKAETMEELKAEAQKEDEEIKKHDEEIREEGRKETRDKYIEYLRKKRMKKAASDLEELATKEDMEAEQRAELESHKDSQSDHERDEYHYPMERFGRMGEN